MKTLDLFSKAVLAKDLGTLLLHAAVLFENKNTESFDCGYIEVIVNDLWHQFSMVRDVTIKVTFSGELIDDMRFSVYVKNNPLPLVELVMFEW